MPTNIYESVKQALQDIVAPELRALQVEIKRLDEKIDGVKEDGRNLREEIRNLREELSNLREELNTRISGLGKQLDTTIDLHERIATIEAKLAIGR